MNMPRSTPVGALRLRADRHQRVMRLHQRPGPVGLPGLVVRARHAALSQRIADELRRQIRAGDPAPGQRTPAETDLTERFRVSLPTVRQALAVLRAEGLIESRHGIGTFGKENRRLQRRSRHRYARARQDQQLLTSHLRHEITAAGREPTPEHVATLFADQPTELVVRRRVWQSRDLDRWSSSLRSAAVATCCTRPQAGSSGRPG